jgi:hypothetical protein
MSTNNNSSSNKGQGNPIKQPNPGNFEKRSDTGRHTDRTTSSKPGTTPPPPKK